MLKSGLTLKRAGAVSDISSHSKNDAPNPDDGISRDTSNSANLSAPAGFLKKSSALPLANTTPVPAEVPVKKPGNTAGKKRAASKELTPGKSDTGSEDKYVPFSPPSFICVLCTMPIPGMPTVPEAAAMHVACWRKTIEEGSEEEEFSEGDAMSQSSDSDN